MLEDGFAGVEVDREDVEPKMDGLAMQFWKLAQVGRGHLAEHVLFVSVNGQLGRSDPSRAAGFDLKNNQHGAVPGDKIEVSSETFGTPAASNDGVAQRTEVEEGGIFSALAEKQVRRKMTATIGQRAQPGVAVAFQCEGELC